VKKPQHPQATAAKRKQLASHAAGAGGSGGSVPAKPAHPNAKAAKAAKHHAAAKKAKAARKPRKWSPDESVALCSARAVAEALRLASGTILSHTDMLALYWATASDPDAGASILATLRVALEWQVKESAVIGKGQRCEYVQAQRLALPDEICSQVANDPHALILGLDLPWGEPHAVTVDIDGTWWSWGEPFTAADFPGAVIEEAWLICAG
jgi:hypothetical protein